MTGPRRCAVLAGAVLAALLAGCGTSASAGQSQRSTASASPADAGTTIQLGGIIDVLQARIPQPGADATHAQVEMTLADTDPATPADLLAATSPAAHHVVFTRDGRDIPRITIPVAAGYGLGIGPPYPDRILLTGLRRQLRAGQMVALTLDIVGISHATVDIPVISDVP